MKISTRLAGAWLLLAPCLFAIHVQAQNRKRSTPQAATDRLLPLPPGAVHLSGHIGKKIDQCIHNRIMVQTTDNLVALFQTKNLDPGGYRGEFIGKWAAAAALAVRYQSNPELEKRMAKAMKDLIASQTTEGYISTYKKEAELKVWDVWIQKYVLLGLIAQYDVTGNSDYLQAAKASTDHLLSVTGPGKLSVEEYGPPFHKGGVNFSILEPIVLLYERTGDKKYLDYATWIVELWSKPGKHSPNGIRLIENAEAGKPLIDYEVMHSYALMSDFEGLCELYRATGKKIYLDACIKVAKAIKEYELMIVGTLSNHEMWYNGTRQQTGILERPNETCATATWMKLCYQLLRLTGDPAWADEMETSLYNGLLGAMMPRGEWWSYDSHLMGERVPSRIQGDNLSCCVSSGPRALLLTPGWASMMGADGSLVVNLYSAGSSVYQLQHGETVQINQQTDYPRTGVITFQIEPVRETSFALKLRIPAWSSNTVLKVNGKEVAVTAGAYASIDRRWKAGDIVSLELDMRGRIVPAPGGETQQAIVRGPIVLAMDSRLAREQDSAIWLIASPHVYEDFPGNTPVKDYILPVYNYPAAGKSAYIDLKPVATQDTNIWLAFEVPFVVRPSFQVHREKPVVMCDFSSAGNQWNEHNQYRVWMPQPMFMGNMYAKNTWKFSVYNAKTRTTVPGYIQAAVYTEGAAADPQQVEGFDTVVFHYNANRLQPCRDFRGMAPGYMTAGWWAAGQMKKNVLSWKTAPAPEKKETIFHFIAASAVLPTEFTRGPKVKLTVNGKYALTFQIGFNRNFNWKEGDYELRYVSKRVEYPYFGSHRQLELNGNSGIYQLTVPASAIEAGKPVTLEVELLPFDGWDKGWFMVKKRKDVLKETVESLEGEIETLRQDVATINEQTHILATRAYADLTGSGRFQHKVIYSNGFRHEHPADIVKLKNGEILMMTREASEHYAPDGDVVMLRSKDGGKTWGGRQVVGKLDMDEREGCAVQLKDGTIVMGVFFNDLYRNDGTYPFGEATDAKRPANIPPLGAYVITSKDNGYTWSEPYFIDMKEMPFKSLEGPTDAPIEMPDGSVLMAVIGYAPNGDKGDRASVMLQSKDKGKTWKYLSIIADDPGGKLGGFLEPGIALTKTGRIVAVMRNHAADQALWSTYSDDGGKTWAPVQKTDMIGHPADVIQLKDGRLMCSYGIRTGPHAKPGGIRVCFSKDNGVTWDIDTEIQLRSDFINWDTGYPESIQLADGSIMTVYYYNLFGKYYIGATYWKL